MFTSTIAKVCFVLFGAVSVRGKCLVKPKDGVLKIPLDMIKVPNEAFSTCVDLRVVIIHADVKSIGYEAFYSTDVEVVKFEEASRLKFIDRDVSARFHSLHIPKLFLTYHCAVS